MCVSVYGSLLSSPVAHLVLLDGLFDVVLQPSLSDV